MLSPNTILQSRYRIVRQLGRGGMGAVYEAVDQRLSRTVALKETLVESAELRHAFEREARLLANLNHPALPRVVDHFSEDAGQYLVMDYIPGDDLKALLGEQGHPFPVNEVMRWANELLDALEYLHTHEPPVIHRDIKPSNLKLTAKGRIALLDFGLAKGSAGQMTIATLSQSILGYSPHFAPLEQIQGDKTNPRSDLYALAATLYNLLANRVPPDALTRATALLSDEIDPLQPLNQINPEVSKSLASVITQALALRPAQRPVSAVEMRAQLQKDTPKFPFKDHIESEADEITVLSQPSRSGQPFPPAPIWRRKGAFKITPLVVSGVIMLSVIAAIFYYQRTRTTSEVARTDTSNVGTNSRKDNSIKAEVLSSTTPPETTPSPSPTPDIRKINFKKVGLPQAMDGEGLEGDVQKVKKVGFGDLDGDGLEEAAVLVDWNFTQGNGWGSRGYVYTLKNGKLTLLSRFIETGKPDVLIDVKIQNSQLISMKCIEDFSDENRVIETTRYRLSGARVIRSGVTRSRRKTSKSCW